MLSIAFKPCSKFVLRIGKGERLPAFPKRGCKNAITLFGYTVEMIRLLNTQIKVPIKNMENQSAFGAAIFANKKFTIKIDFLICNCYKKKKNKKKRNALFPIVVHTL
jgi:predicted outer membrane repeat protein